MALSTVNISFKDDLLKQIDEVARNETRTRSELIREAAWIYIEQKKKWESIFAYGESISSKYKFTEEDVNREIKKYREEKRKNKNNYENCVGCEHIYFFLFWGRKPKKVGRAGDQ